MIGKLIGGIAALLVIIIGLGFVLPDRVEVEREIVINAPQEEVFALVSDFGAWDQWSPWANIDPDAQYTLTGEGVGQRMEWKSDHPEVGSGVQEITVLEAPELVTTSLDFGDMGRAEAHFRLVPTTEGNTKVIWSLHANMRDGVPVPMQPMATYMGFFMDSMMGPVYDEGLGNLKRIAENAPAPEAA